MARWLTPPSARRASMACRRAGSGVVSEPGSSMPGALTPRVPRLAAAIPMCAQIWRVKLATEVLPLVPVTAATTSGWAP